MMKTLLSRYAGLSQDVSKWRILCKDYRVRVVC